MSETLARGLETELMSDIQMISVLPLKCPRTHQTRQIVYCPPFFGQVFRLNNLMAYLPYCVRTAGNGIFSTFNMLQPLDITNSIVRC